MAIVAELVRLAPRHYVMTLDGVRSEFDSVLVVDPGRVPADEREWSELLAAVDGGTVERLLRELEPGATER